MVGKGPDGGVFSEKSPEGRAVSAFGGKNRGDRSLVRRLQSASGFRLRLVLGGSCFLVVDTGGAAHAVLAHEAIHAALGVEDFLGACEERMVSAPDVHMDFGLCGASGHDHFSIADHLGVGIPGGMNVGLGHDRDQRLENWGALRAFLRPYLRRSLALGSRLR